jgi:predicted nucleotidyltransferase
MSEPANVSQQIEALTQLVMSNSEIELAVLVGSQATGKADQNSDWDLALQWKRTIEPLQLLGKTEQLRSTISNLLTISAEKIDLIDIPTAGLTMRAVVAEEGILLKGDNTLEWSHFLQRTWRELEEFDYMERTGAA